jgi:hypothetical protein
MKQLLLSVLVSVLGIWTLISPTRIFAQSSYQGPVISGHGTTVQGSRSTPSTPTIRETRPMPGAFPTHQSAPAAIQPRDNSHFEVQTSGDTPHRQQ